MEHKANKLWSKLAASAPNDAHALATLPRPATPAELANHFQRDNADRITYNPLRDRPDELAVRGADKLAGALWRKRHGQMKVFTPNLAAP